jgi:Histidinol dehydrogenase
MIEKIINPPREKWKKINIRPNYSSQLIDNKVKKIFMSVKKNGDKALFRYAEKYEGVKLKKLNVQQENIQNSKNLISEDIKNSIKMQKRISRSS